MDRWSLALAFVLLTASCYEDWRDDYNFEWHGEHASVYGYGYTEDDVCGGSLAELDKHSAVIADDLGITINPFVYRWISDEFRSQIDYEPCGIPGAACAPVDGAISRSLPFMHEALHMITRTGADECPSLLDEGLAMYYSGPVLSSPYSSNKLDATKIRQLIDEFPYGKNYMEAMHFVSFLAETYGPPAIAALCEALPNEPSRAQWEDATRDTLGVPLEQLLADYDTYPQCTYSQMRAKLWGCQRPTDFQLYTESQSYTIESDCNDPQATNAGGGPGDAVLRRLLFVPWDMVIDVGVYALPDRQGSEPAYMITECAACSENPGVFAGVDGSRGHNFHTLRAGHYEVSVFFDRRDRVALRLSVFAVQEL